MSSEDDRTWLAAKLSAESFGLFSKAVFPQLSFARFHVSYYRILQAFAEGRLRRLIVTMPPQHGKSQGSTRLLPAYLLGIKPDLRIAIASYSDTFAKKFNRDVQRVIDTPTYAAIFPDTKLNRSNLTAEASNAMRTSSEFEIVGHLGGLKAVGRGGGLTGNTVDVLILDDLYKDAMEANSPTIREAAWDWYNSVARTRLHNDSQELIVFTRWHEEDLVGMITKRERVFDLKTFEQLDALPNGHDVWARVNFEAIKESEPTEIDDREPGAPLWPARHSIESLQVKRKLDPHTFQCLYQGAPSSREGLLYGRFETYNAMPGPDLVIKRGAYIDTADTGTDFLCAISYVVANDLKVYVNDVLYTQEPMEVTEISAAELLVRTGTRIAYVESNNGGRGFARAIQRLVPSIRVEWFHQGGNKEARILSNAPTVMQAVRFPKGWDLKWPSFFAHLSGFKRNFRANAHDDGADALTGVVEREIQNRSGNVKIRII